MSRRRRRRGGSGGKGSGDGGDAQQKTSGSGQTKGGSGDRPKGDGGKRGGGSGGGGGKRGGGGGKRGRRRGGGRRGGGNRRREGAGFWGDAEKLPQAQPDIRITEQPDAVVRSLGPPPLPGHEKIAEHYFTAVYDRAVMIAGALGAAGGLIEPDELAEELSDD